MLDHTSYQRKCQRRSSCSKRAISRKRKGNSQVSYLVRICSMLVFELVGIGKVDWLHKKIYGTVYSYRVCTLGYV